MKPKDRREEDYKILRTSLISEWKDEMLPACVLITVPEEHPEISMEIAKGLAASLQEVELSPLVIDANVFCHREPQTQAGLCEWLCGEEMPAIEENILPCGTADSLSAKQLLRLPDKLKQAGLSYQYFLIACSGCADHADIAILASACDTSLLIAESGKTLRKAAITAKENLVMAGADILGVVFVK